MTTLITTTLVSAFIANMNSNRTVNDYIKFGLKFLLTPIHKIIFMDETIIIELKKCIPDEYNQYLHIIPIKFEDCYLYEYISQIKNFDTFSKNIEKDTVNYMIAINNKLDFIKKAIEINVFNSTQFIWVDFGIAHINNCLSDLEFGETIVNLKNNIYDKVRNGRMCEPTLQSEEYYITKENIYNYIAWFFAGGVFGGNIESLLQFEKLSREKCLQVIKEKGTIMWEVNIWYMVYLENKELFSLYYGSHDMTLISNY